MKIDYPGKSPFQNFSEVVLGSSCGGFLFGMCITHVFSEAQMTKLNSTFMIVNTLNLGKTNYDRIRALKRSVAKSFGV